MFANGECCPNSNMLIRLWVHEATRVYGDKLVDRPDIDTFNKLVLEMVRKGFEDFNESVVFKEPIIFSHFADGLADLKYMPVKEWAGLSRILEEAQVNYNELVGSSNLVLFEDAMSHICRQVFASFKIPIFKDLVLCIRKVITCWSLWKTNMDGVFLSNMQGKLCFPKCLVFCNNLCNFIVFNFAHKTLLDSFFHIFFTLNAQHGKLTKVLPSFPTRINRILENARGYALLVGVGGSGKQSLTRLAAFISSLDVSQIQLRKGYAIADLKADLAVIYTKTAVKNAPCCFLMTDSQVFTTPDACSHCHEFISSNAGS